MPDVAYLVVPYGTVLPRDLQVCVVDGCAYETDPAGEHIAVDTAIDVFDNVTRDIYQLCLAPECNIAYDVETKVIEGRNFVPDAIWSAVFHTFVNEEDVFVTVHHDGQVGQVIFAANGHGGVRLQLGPDYSVNEQNLVCIRDFGRLVRAINKGKG